MADPGLLTGTREALNVGALVAEVEVLLVAGGVGRARREAQDLLAAVLDVPRFWPLANPGTPVDDATREATLRAAGMRGRGAPFAYAVGRAAFRHLVLDVDERVLIPRQETEQLVEELLALASERGGVAIDVGTGSGAIALALATEGRFARVIATDISLDALAVARRNVAALAPVLRAPVELRHGSFLAPVRRERASVIVSNPPYIAHDEFASLPASVRDWEPGIALSTGAGGMAAIARLVRGAADILEPRGLLALEVDARRSSLAAELLACDARYANVSVRLDLAGRERFVFAERRGHPS